MTFDEIIQRLEDMRPRFDAGFSVSDRVLLDALYGDIYNKPITLTGCSDCYRDAYLLINNYLKKNGKMPDPSNYRLRRGVVMHDFGSTEYYVLDVSDEVAEKYLIKDQNNINDFERYPDDWKERITRRIAAESVGAIKADNDTETNQKTATRAKKGRPRKQ